MHSMVLLGDQTQAKAHFGPFEDIANLDARQVHGLHRTYHRLENHFTHTQKNFLVMWVIWTLTSVHLETVLVSVQDRCTICAERTTGLEIVLDAHDGTTR
jgi:hypothetical protein